MTISKTTKRTTRAFFTRLLSVSLAVTVTVTTVGVTANAGVISGNGPSLATRIDRMFTLLKQPGQILGSAKDSIEESVGEKIQMIQSTKADIDRFKGRGCGIDQRSPCATLKRQLKSIYTNMRELKNHVPGYEFLPSSDTESPIDTMIEKLPVAPLYGMSTILSDLSVLDDLQMVSVWVAQLRFYSSDPVEEDLFYRLDENECQVLEESLLIDNQVFDRMKNVMQTTAKVTGIAMDILPKDIVINAWFGTNVPNPVYPALVLSNRMATDFETRLDNELVARGEQVKKCRTQRFRSDVLDQLDELLEY